MYISQRIFVKIWNGPNRIRRGQGENWFVEKTLKSKISCQAPFKYISVSLRSKYILLSYLRYLIHRIPRYTKSLFACTVYRTRMLYVIWTQLVICTFASAKRTYKDTEQPLFLQRMTGRKTSPAVGAVAGEEGIPLQANNNLQVGRLRPSTTTPRPTTNFR